MLGITKYIFRGLTTNDFLNEIFIGNVASTRLDFQDNSINTVEILITGTDKVTSYETIKENHFFMTYENTFQFTTKLQ